MNQQRLVSQIEEIGADIGQPDCKLTEPFIVKDDNTLSPWLVESTNQSVFMLSSDKILNFIFLKKSDILFFHGAICICHWRRGLLTR